MLRHVVLLLLLSACLPYSAAVRRSEDADDAPDDDDYVLETPQEDSTQTDTLTSDAPDAVKDNTAAPDDTAATDDTAAPDDTTATDDTAATDEAEAEPKPWWHEYWAASRSWIMGGIPLLFYGLYKWQPWKSTTRTSMPPQWCKCRWAGCANMCVNPEQRGHHERSCDHKMVKHGRCKQLIKASELEAHKTSCCDSEEINGDDSDNEIDADDN